jgi:Transcriptional regulator
MRIKDDNKKDAIFEATIALLNEIGFADITMSKIGKRAGVSSSTIYVYFENKEDMLKKVYLDVEQKLSAAISRGIQEDTPMQQVVKQLVKNVLTFVLENKQYFLFSEQFSNSPFVDKEDAYRMFQPLINVFENGKRQGLLKQANTELLVAYCYQPIAQVAKGALKRNIRISEEDIQQIIQISWDGIKASHSSNESGDIRN